MKVTEHFTRSELECPCCKEFVMNGDFLLKLERMRIMLNMPITPLSATRCPKHNEKVGGVPESLHILGCAIDPKVTDSTYRYRLLNAALFVGMNHIGIGRNKMHTGYHERYGKTPVVFVYN